MSKRFQQLQKIRSWSVEQVQIQLKQFGLNESSEGVRKREVDGDALLALTEGKLALWRDVCLLEKKQLLKLIEDLQTHPENYVEPVTKAVVQAPKPDVLPTVETVATSSSGKSSPVSDADSWGTDFSDDKDVEYSNFDAMEPPVPAVKPENLPKPPLPPESSNYGHVRNIVSGLNLPDHHDVYDDDEYESLDADAVVLSHKVLQPSNYEQYESIKDETAGPEYYLEPIQPRSAGPLPPPVPDKKWTQPLPQRHSNDSSAHTSPGNSGDGVTGLFGELFRKMRGPDLRERTAVPTVPPSSSKPLPPEPRSGGLNTHRPLPPTPQIKGVKSRQNPKLELTHQPWYHNVDRKQSEELLKNGVDGSFLVRPSSQGHNALTLTLWYNGRLYNICIRHRSDGRYALGTEKAKEQSFMSVEELIENYRSEKLVLYSSGEKTGQALLTTSPHRAPC